MPDYSFIANPAPQDAMKPVSSLLGIANAAQHLQQGNVALEQERIKLGERKGIQELFSNPAQFHDADGNPDYNKLINMGMEKAPTTFPAMVPQIITAHKEGVAAKQALNTFNEQQRTNVGQFVMSLGDDTPDVAAKKLGALVNANPQLKPWVDFANKVYLGPAANDPAKWKEATQSLGRSVVPVATQVEMATPSGPTVSSNVQTGVMNLKPTAGPVGIVPGTVVNQQLPLGERQVVQNNPVTQSPQTVTKDAFGVVQGVTQTPTGPGVPVLAPGQAQDLPIVVRERADINAAASQVPTQRFNNQQIIQLASDPSTLALTGAGAAKWAKVASAVGVPWTGDRATNFQKLGHYIALQAQNNAKAMGAGTDAAREVSGLATGTTEMTPEALVSATKTNDALATGLENFNKGLEVAIRNAGGNVLATRDFRNQWSGAFDPNVYRYVNALGAGDRKEIDSILGKSGPARQAKAQELLQKYQRLQQLTTQGR